MNFQQFLAKITEKTWWDAQPIYWFVYTDEEHFPSLFFSKLRKHAQDASSTPVQLLKADQGLDALYAQLETSFLGASWRYIISCASMESKEIAKFLAYSHQYKGPHTLVIFVADEYAQSLPTQAGPAQAVVKLDEYVDEATCLKMAATFGYTLSSDVQKVLHRVFREYPRVPFASAFMVIEYTQLAGATPGNEAALLAVLKELLRPDSSLFTLSQLFFAQQPEAFYRYLATVVHLYPEQFWVSFWSEQLYRAFFYVTYMQRGNQEEAKKIGVRLPFAFLQRDWRRYSPQKLAQSHAFLYELDTALKNGHGTLGFERFYHAFFKQLPQ